MTDTSETPQPKTPPTEEPADFYLPLVARHGHAVVEHPVRQPSHHWGTAASAARTPAEIIAERLRAEMPRGDIGEDGMGDTSPAVRSR